MKLTGSKLPLADRCLGAVVLPGVRTESSDAALAGTGRHAYLRRVAEVGRDAALAEIPTDAPWRGTCEGIEVDAIPAGLWEAAYAYHPGTDTARLLGTDTGRDYSGVNEYEISGTADLVTEAEDGSARPWVIDFKGSDAVDPPAHNLQVGFYALCVARVWGVDSARVSICYVHSEGRLEWHHADLDGWDLAVIAAQVRSLWDRAREARAAGRTPDLTAGLHCRYCPAFTACPAQVTLARELVSERDAAAETNTLMLSDESAGKAWVKVAQYRQVLDRIEGALRERAMVRGLPLPDGSRLVVQESARRVLDVDKTLPVLRGLVGDRAESFVERSIASSVVESIAREVAKARGEKLTTTREAVWSQLREGKAVKESTYVQLRVKKPRGAGGDDA